MNRDRYVEWDEQGPPILFRNGEYITPPNGFRQILDRLSEGGVE